MRSTPTTPCWSSQSGERFEGVQNFREWRRQHPAQLVFHTRRITHRDDLVVGENLISYDGAPWKYSVSLLEFRGDKVAHERTTRLGGDVGPDPPSAEQCPRSVGDDVRALLRHPMAAALGDLEGQVSPMGLELLEHRHRNVEVMSAEKQLRRSL